MTHDLEERARQIKIRMQRESELALFGRHSYDQRPVQPVEHDGQRVRQAPLERDRLERGERRGRNADRGEDADVGRRDGRRQKGDTLFEMLPTSVGFQESVVRADAR